MKTIKIYSMKKQYCSIATLVIFMTGIAHSQTVFKLDSIYQYEWDNIMMEWNHNTSDYYTYDNGGTKETNLLRQNLNLGVWENFYQFNKDYNGINDLTENIQQVWDNTGMIWNDASRDTYSYNAEDLNDTFTYAIWSGGSWLNFNQNLYTYDVLGNEIENIAKELNFATMMLDNKMRLTNMYTGLVRNYEIEEQWIVNIWQNNEKTDFFYNGNGDLDLVEIRGWQTMSMDWSAPFQQTILTYNTDDLVEETVEQLFGSGMWNNSARGLYTYASLNLTDITGQEWNSGTMVWDNSFRQLRTYDVDDNETELIFQTWDVLGGVWENILKQEKYWSPEETLGVSYVALADNLKIYPNPVSHSVNINFKNPTESVTVLRLYDMNGKLLVHQKIDMGSTHVEIPMVAVAHGMLMMHLENKDGKRIYKVIKK